MNGYTSRIGIIDTMATVYLITRVFSMFAAACVDMPPEPLTSADRFEDWFRYTYRRCCRVYSSGREDISSSESWNEFQLPTAPKIEIVARIGTDSGRIIFRNTVGVFAPSITADSSSDAGIDSMYVFTRMMLYGAIMPGRM